MLSLVQRSQIGNIKRIGKSFLVGCIALSCLQTSTANAQARLETFTIQKSAIQNTLNQALANTSIRVDNLGARNGGSFLQQDSYVSVRVRQNTEIIRRFDVPEQSFTINNAGGRHLRFYVSSFNSSAIRTSLAPTRGGDIIFQLNFESDGAEVQGRCVTRRGVIRRRWEECRLDLNRNAQINNATLRVWAPLTVRNGRLSYGDPKANFQADVSLDNRLCNLARRSCKTISDKVKSDIANGLVSSVKNAMIAARPQIQRALLRTNRNFSRAGFRVVRLTDQGASYRVTISY